MLKSFVACGLTAALAVLTTSAHADLAPARPALPAAPAKPASAKPAEPVMKPATPAVPPAAAPKPGVAIPAKEPAPPAPPTPTPAPEVAEFAKAMKGTWKCKGQMFDMATQQNKPAELTWVWKTDLDGFWLVGTLTEKKSKTSPTPYKMTSYRTYDAATKTWSNVFFDNMGMTSTSTSKGPQNGATTFDASGTWNGQKYWTRDKEELKSPKELIVSGEMSLDGKQWTPMYNATCTR